MTDPEIQSPGDALTHVITCAQIDPGHPEITSDESGALLDSHLASLGWHLIHTNPNENVRVFPDDVFITVHRPGYQTVVAPDHDDPELAAISAILTVLGAQRYLVTAGTSFTITKAAHDDERGAKLEVLRRLGHASGSGFYRGQLGRKLEWAKARPATDADFARFAEMADQERNRRQLIEAVKSVEVTS